MRLKLTGHHVEVTPALRAYIEKKLERIKRHFDQVIDVSCTMTVEKLQHKAEATVHVSGGNIHVYAVEADMYAAIDSLSDKLDRSMVKHKENSRTITPARAARPRVHGTACADPHQRLSVGQERSEYAEDLTTTAWTTSRRCQPFIPHTGAGQHVPAHAVGIDARNTPAEIATVPALLQELKSSGIACEMLFLTARDDELLRRFAETRRKHPMSRGTESLHEAIDLERRMLEPIVQASDFVMDTSRMGTHDLREMIRSRVDQRQHSRISILFESFGFKYGIPGDADFVFDARSLPNPYWEPELRGLTGRDAEVARYLERSEHVPRLIADITHFVEARIPEYRASNRRYFTVAIGCTGGQHRSVYLVEKIAADFASRFPDVSARHSGLAGAVTQAPGTTHSGP
jgi:UPF0042 nucleotide-binding protein